MIAQKMSVVHVIGSLHRYILLATSGVLCLVAPSAACAVSSGQVELKPLVVHCESCRFLEVWSSWVTVGMGQEFRPDHRWFLVPLPWRVSWVDQVTWRWGMGSTWV